MAIRNFCIVLWVTLSCVLVHGDSLGGVESNSVPAVSVEIDGNAVDATVHLAPQRQRRAADDSARLAFLGTTEEGGVLLDQLYISQTSPDVIIPAVRSGGNATFDTYSIPGRSLQSFTSNHHQDLFMLSDPLQGDVVALVDRTASITVENIVSDGVKGMAYDWISANLYWADPKYNRISVLHIRVASSDTTYRKKTLITDDLQHPWGLVVDPQQELLCWTDRDRGVVECSNLVGTDRKTVSTTPRPTGLCLRGDVLYWLEEGSGIVRQHRADGTGETSVFAEADTLTFMNSLFVYEDWLFVIHKDDNATAYLQYYNTVDSSMKGIVGLEGTVFIDIEHVMVISPSLQPTDMDDPCSEMLCAQFCIPNAGAGECFCEDGSLSYEKLCTEVTSRLTRDSVLFARDDGDLCSVPAELADLTTQEAVDRSLCWDIDISSSTPIAAHYYDSVAYVQGSQKDDLVRVKVAGDDVYKEYWLRDIGTSDLQALAVDWITGNVYFSLATRGGVGVFDKQGNFLHVILEDYDSVTAMLVVPSLGKLYVGGFGVGLFSCDLAGNEVTEIDFDFDTPYLVMDPRNSALYWITRDTLHRYNVDTSDKTTYSIPLTVALTGLDGFALYEDYFILYSGTFILFLELDQGALTLHKVMTGMPARQLTTWSALYQPITEDEDLCSDSPCAQLCFPGPSGSLNLVCACAIGYSLQADGSDCQPTALPADAPTLLISDVRWISRLSMSGLSSAVRLHDTDGAAGKMLFDDVYGFYYWVQDGHEIRRATVHDPAQAEVFATMASGSEFIDMVLNRAENVILASVRGAVVGLASVDLFTGAVQLVAEDWTLDHAPTALAFDETRQILFYSRTDEAGTTIFRKPWTAASTENTIASMGSPGSPGSPVSPVELTLDTSGEDVYWCRVRAGFVGYTSYTGAGGGSITLRLLTGCSAITFHQSALYIADRKTNFLSKYDLTTRREESFASDQVFSVRSMAFIKPMSSVVYFNAGTYTGNIQEGQAAGSSVTFAVPPQAEGGAGGFTYALIGTLASSFNVDSSSAVIKLSASFSIASHGHSIGSGSTKDLGIQATDSEGNIAKVAMRVRINAAAESAMTYSLIVADTELQSLMKVDLDNLDIRFISGTASPSPAAVALDSIENWLYWSDLTTAALMRLQVTAQGEEEEEAEVFYQLQSGATPEGLYIDSDRGTVYYADSRFGVIGSVDIASKQHTVLLQLQQDEEPRAVVVDNNGEFLYFTTRGENPSISRLRLSDGGRQAIMTTSLAQPNGLALNNTAGRDGAGRLYYCDGYGIVGSINVDGTAKSELFQKSGFSCTDVALRNGGQSYLYVASWSERRIAEMRLPQTDDTLSFVHTVELSKPSGVVSTPWQPGISFAAAKYEVVVYPNAVRVVPRLVFTGGLGDIKYSLEGNYKNHFNINRNTGEITAKSSLDTADLSPKYTDGDRECFGSGTSADLAIRLEDSFNEVARVALTPCITETVFPTVDPCSVKRGGCEQYCALEGAKVTCFCSDSFVQSKDDPTKCEDPCATDNGGCSQLCSVDSVSHKVKCACYDGYSVDPDDSRKCIEKNECEVQEVTCRNGGTCVDLVNMFICKCTANWAGQYCGQRIIYDPKLANINRLKGPVAGKSRIRLTGIHFVDGVLVRLGEDLVCVYISSNETAGYVLTPPVNETLYADKRLPITVEFPGFEPNNTGLFFTYKGNPKLKSVEPLAFHARGGTNITVAGQNLDVIADPIIEITMVHTLLKRGAVQPANKAFENPCEVTTDSAMACLSPPIEIPAAFKNWDQNLTIAQNETNRQRRSSSTSSSGRYRRDVDAESDLTLVLPDQTLDFYIGFKLDGVKSYENLSDTTDMIDYAKALVHDTAPTVNITDFDPFVPNSGVKIHITGEGFTRGFQASDYKVSIGDGFCNVTDVTFSEIICAPPDEVPAEKKDVDVSESRKKRNVPAENQVDVPESRKKRNVPAENQIDVPESRKKRNVQAENQVDVSENRKKRNAPAEKQDVDVSENRKKRNAPAEDQDVGAAKSRKKRAIKKVPLAVIVHAGTGLELEAGILPYHIPDSNLAVILGSVFAGVAVIIIAIVVVCCWYRRHKVAVERRAGADRWHMFNNGHTRDTRDTRSPQHPPWSKPGRPIPENRPPFHQPLQHPRIIPKHNQGHNYVTPLANRGQDYYPNRIANQGYITPLSDQLQGPPDYLTPIPEPYPRTGSQTMGPGTGNYYPKAGRLIPRADPRSRSELGAAGRGPGSPYAEEPRTRNQTTVRPFNNNNDNSRALPRGGNSEARRQNATTQWVGNNGNYR